MNEFIQIRDVLREFAAVRDWQRFHKPKNLAIALSVEAGELLEHFQWLDDAAVVDPDQASLEMADVLIYLIQIADALDVDLLAATRRKIGINATKYPVLQDDLFHE